MRLFRVTHLRRAVHSGTNVTHGPDAISDLLGTSSDVSDGSKRTLLYGLHREQAAHWGTFAGYNMPLWYRDSGSIAEHHHTRNSCSIFDVSHMLQVSLYGKDVYNLLHKVTITDFSSRANGKCKLSCILKPDGMTIDDCIFTPDDNGSEPRVFAVFNASNGEKDVNFLRQHAAKLGMDVHIDALVSRSLVALQGPKAAEILAPHLPPQVDLTQWPFMTGMVVPVGGFACRVTRCGYTGEDGFEISVANNDVDALTRKLLAHPACKLAGLAARDTLRLEAGLSLFGSDMDESTTPIEGGVRFLLTKAKREATDWYGRDLIVKQFNEGPPRIKTGLAFPNAKRCPRHGAKVVDPETGEALGEVSSGCPSPLLGYPIALALLKPGLKPGQPAIVSRSEIGGVVHSLPFVPTRYYRVPKAAPQ